MSNHQRRAELTGEVSLRPARLAILVDPDELGTILDAIALATAVWGGIYYILLDIKTDPAEARVWLDMVGVDAVVSVRPEHQDSPLLELAAFRWIDVARLGPFAPPQDNYTVSVLTTEWLLGRTETLEYYSDAEPLTRIVHSSLFGTLQGPTQRHHAAEALADASMPVQVLPGNMSIEGVISLLDLTRVETGVDTRGEIAGIYVLEPGDGDALIDFWNMRACGVDLVPWVRGDEALNAYVQTWVSRIPQSVDAGEIVIFPASLTEIPASLVALESLSVRLANPLDRPVRWRYSDSQVQSRFSSLFTATLRDDSKFDVQIPRMVSQYLQHGDAGIGIVFADLLYLGDESLPTGRVAKIPAFRSAWQQIFHANTLSPHERATRSGRTIAVVTTEQSVSLYLVWSLRIFQEMLQGGEWEPGVSDSGQFAQYFMESLGGARSDVANQPAVLSTLSEVGRSRKGHPLGKLIPAARRYRGEWPSKIDRFASKWELEYAKRVVYMLLERKVLRPILPLRCPFCTNESGYAPEQLLTDVGCELCGQSFPLGLALAVNGKSANEWNYRLAGNVSEGQVSESLAIMATLHTLRTSLGGMSGSSEVTTLGLKLTSKRHPCEIDIATVVPYGVNDSPVVLLGEVKSWRDELEDDDLEKLGRVQRFFLDRGIVTQVLFSTYRDQLTDGEKERVWRFMERSVRASIDGLSVELLPLIFCGDDIKVHWHHERHPSHWNNRGRSIHELAAESCRRNVYPFIRDSASGSLTRADGG